MFVISHFYIMVMLYISHVNHCTHTVYISSCISTSCILSSQGLTWPLQPSVYSRPGANPSLGAPRFFGEISICIIYICIHIIRIGFKDSKDIILNESLILIKYICIIMHKISKLKKFS